MQSSIALSSRIRDAEDQAGAEEAGDLSAVYLSSIPSSTMHLTLQACSLGRAVVGSSDELWGVMRAALAGGIPSVLGPLWNIDIDSSTFLVRRFYEHWLTGGLPKWNAFTAAQNDMLSHPNMHSWRHPYHWAAFKLIGI
jgi:CHAT domain-containing protein